ncbi:MAG: hypothetical protein ACI9OS_001376, partial [Ulvibacter sp.]
MSILYIWVLDLLIEAKIVSFKDDFSYRWYRFGGFT